MDGLYKIVKSHNKGKKRKITNANINKNATMERINTKHKLFHISYKLLVKTFNMYL